MARINCSSNSENRGNSVTSKLKLPNTRLKLSKRDLDDIKRQVEERLFVKGHNSNDVQMARAKSYRREFYRYFSGKLKNSISVKQVRSNIHLTFRRKTVILDCLVERYGKMFQWSPNDMEFVENLLRQRYNLPRYDVRIVD